MKLLLNKDYKADIKTGVTKYLSDLSRFSRLRRGQSHFVLPYFTDTKVSKIFSFSKQIPQKKITQFKIPRKHYYTAVFRYTLLRHCRVAQITQRSKKLARDAKLPSQVKSVQICRTLWNSPSHFLPTRSRR